jgi:putative transposase
MEIRLSAHGAYHHRYHRVWIPKYRRKVLTGDLKECVAKRRNAIPEDHPAIEVEQGSIQLDPGHLVAVIPPNYAVAAVVGKIKANTSREIRQRFPEITKGSWRHACWSVGFFSSTVGSDEAVIKRYVEFQEKVDKGQLKLQLDFGF